MSIRRIAEFLAETRYDLIPPEALVTAKRGVVDFLGVALVGSRQPVSDIVARYAEQTKALGEASVFGKRLRTSADLAAWANGTMSHALDYDDTFADAARCPFHPTVTILPAVMALGEKQASTGRDILAAYIAGLEVEYRIGAVLGSYLPKSGWHTVSTLGTIGAAAASANLLRLDATRAQLALGIAGSLAGGMLWNFGTMTKPLHAGNASRNGVLAALLARDGFTANESILEGDMGFCGVFSRGKVDGLRRADSDLGITWNIISLGLGFKPYPSCRSTHSSIDATLHLAREFNIQPEQVAEVICRTSPVHTRAARFHKPRTGLEGKFSITYCVATALRQGKIELEDFTDEKVNAREAQELLSRVNFEYPDSCGSDVLDLAAEITIKLRDGRAYSYRVSLPKGEPGNPMTDDELAGKFRNCARPVLSPQAAEKALDLAWRLDKLEDTSGLMHLCSACVLYR